MGDIEEANTSTNTSGGHGVADSMMISITDVVSKPRRRDPPTIYKVPQIIRHGNKDVYEPKILSIGPYHHGEESLRCMEEHKWRYLNSILSRNPEHQLENYVEEIEGLEDQARSCYSDFVGDEFVKMMVLDGCFLVELFLKLKDMKQLEQKEDPKKKEEIEEKEEFLLKLKGKELEQKEEPNQNEELKQNEEHLLNLKEKLKQLQEDLKDPIIGTIWMLPLIAYDMLLLENQIPFFILQRIFEMASPENGSLAKLALDFFDGIIKRNMEIQITDSYHHLLHLFHSHLIPTPTPSNKLNLSSNSTVQSIPNKEPNLLSNPTVESVLNKLKNLLMFFPSSNKTQLPIISNNPSRLSRPPVMMIPCAADLQLAGVKFKNKEDSSSILDVKFSHGVLEIPYLLIHDSTNTLLRNLIAFEQCYYPNTIICFTSYVWFMDCIVNTSKDVALLHRNGIIDYLLGSDEEVAQLFNQLSKGTVVDLEESYLYDLYKDVKEHCKTEWNMWLASLRRDYFTNPWSGLSSIAAIILILIAITQTFFTVFSYYRPRS